MDVGYALSQINSRLAIISMALQFGKFVLLRLSSKKFIVAFLWEDERERAGALLDIS